MQMILMEKLRGYIHQNNPDLMLELQREFRLTAYLEEQVTGIQGLLAQLTLENKPVYIIEELCLNAMTAALRPSKFNRIISILETEFENDSQRMKSSGILTYEAMNLIAVCAPVFETFGFTESNENDNFLYYALTGSIQEYLKPLSDSE